MIAGNNVNMAFILDVYIKADLWWSEQKICAFEKVEHIRLQCTPWEVVNHISNPPQFQSIVKTQLISTNSAWNSLSCSSSSLPWSSSRNVDESQNPQRGRNQNQNHPDRESQNHHRANQSRQGVNQSHQPSTMRSKLLQFGRTKSNLRFRWTEEPTGGTCWWNLARYKGGPLT